MGYEGLEGAEDAQERVCRWKRGLRPRLAPRGGAQGLQVVGRGRRRGLGTPPWAGEGSAEHRVCEWGGFQVAGRV